MSSASFSAAGNRSFGAPDGPFADGPGSRSDGSAAQQVKAGASALIDDVKDSAQSHINEKKGVAAEQLHNVADALRDAAQRGSGEDPLFGLTGSAADGLDRLSSALRNKDVGVMMRDMESFARAQPVAFFGLALATGFLAVRFLKASQS